MAKQRRKWQVPQVVFQPEVHRGMQDGIRQVVNAIRPTLGPFPRYVAVESTIRRDKAPELLDNGAVIARRIIQLKDRDQDVGAMVLRHTLWKLHEKVGDGTASAALIFESIYRQGVRYITAGGNAMQLRTLLEQSVPMLLDEMDKITVPIEGKERLRRLADTICYDAELAKMLGEIFDITGEYGRLEIRTGRGRNLEREYIEGMYWDGGMLSRHMASDQTRMQAKLEEASVLITDLEIDDPQEIVSLLEMASGAGIQRLLLVANKISEKVLAVALMKQNREKINLLAVKTPGLNSEAQQAALEDLAFLTGGKPLFKATGAKLSLARPEDTGKVRRVWADLDNFGVSGGKGDPRALRQHITRLRDACANSLDIQTRKRLLERVGKLMGGSATLWIGDATQAAIEARRALAERTAEAMRGALHAGVVPGGGSAFLACCPALAARIRQVDDPDERAAYRMVHIALQEPLRALLANAGYNCGEILAQIEQAGPCYGFDLKSRQVVNMLQAGIVDSAAVIREVLFSVIHSAAMLLTTDILIHRSNPPEAIRTT